MRVAQGRIACWLGLCLGLTGCGSEGGPTEPMVEPTLASIQQNVFDTGCALFSCHSSASQRGGLVLEDGRSYAQLVNAPAENGAARGAGKLRVVPGHPEQSFLLDKLTGPGPGEGSLMPYTGSRLSRAQVDVIRTWIRQGAKPE